VIEASGLRIRLASADDAPGIARVLNRIIEGGRHSLLDTPFSEAEERAYIESLPGRAFIHAAETAEGEIVGFQTVEPWSTFVTREFDHVATIGTYVGEEYRRRGVGAALAAASFAAARGAGYEKILTDLRADNLGSLCYHLSLGFSVVGTARRHARLHGRDIDVVFIEAFL
jgi:L-amino acid N-acyltransferase YncA